MCTTAALELAPKAQVLEGCGIKGHFEIQSLRNGVSRGFQEVFSIADAINEVKDKLKVFMQNRPCDMQNFDL